MKKKWGVILIWLMLWYGLDVWIGNDILFAGPVETGSALLRLGATRDFWLSVGGTMLRVITGGLLGSLAGIGLAVLGRRFPPVDDFLSPFVAVVKAVPVVSFVILVLIWFGNRRVSLVISGLIVFPILYLNTRSGLGSVDRKLLEMAEVFGMGPGRRLKLIWWPALRPHLLSALSLALGMSFKGGVAAEVIGQPLASIGNSIYRAKILLSTDEVFAWSVVTILLSFLLERGVRRLIREVERP